MISILHLEGISIFEQLQLEEALLRADSRNWCILNTNVKPAIVMGISGKPEELVNLEAVHRDNIPLIKRFSGGGTVYVDENTLFVTFICQTDEFNVAPTPHTIMEWSERIYKPLIPDFQLKENDYVVGLKKCGGNAQYIRKGRWLHHTSFLWDYNPEKMEYLYLPKKRPQYRQDRRHSDFLCTLKEYHPHKEALLEKIKNHLAKTYSTQEISLNEFSAVLGLPHRKSTSFLTPLLKQS